jgi:Icc-related predicted phosphoesterase
LITHAPPRDVGDEHDLAHRGFDCYHALVAALRPALLLHGHVRPDGGRASRMGNTVVRNVVGRHLIDLRAVSGHRAAGAGLGPGWRRA